MMHSVIKRGKFCEPHEAHFIAHYFTLVFGIIAFFHESRLGKWIDNEVYEFIYASESFITTSILLGATKIGEVWAMLSLSLMLIAYLMLKRCKIEALFLY